VVDELFPGFCALVARRGKIVGFRAAGKKVRGGSELVTDDTIFDLESMTKVLSTSVCAMVLVERGKLRLEDPVVRHLPEFKGEGKDKVTVRDMLRYTSGLPLDTHYFDMPEAEIWRRMAESPLAAPPGTRTEYSDLTYRLLGRLVGAVAGVGLDVFARDNVWRPLGMVDTMYKPPPEIHARVAATGVTLRRKTVVRGAVQDDQDHVLGGVCGCDGVFGTAKDVAIFCQMMLAGGAYAGKRVLSAELTAEMVKNQTPFTDEAKTDTSLVANLVATPKGYGFELATKRFSNGGTRLSPGSYGKCGGAGTFMWIDPARQLFGVLLTNHGLPVPFDERGWDRLMDDCGSAEFYDGIVNAIVDE
jgi:CubicO group peptidase (beta-lactamase class C family)